MGARASTGAGLPAMPTWLSRMCPTMPPSGSSATSERSGTKPSDARISSTRSASAGLGKAARWTARMAAASSGRSGRMVTRPSIAAQGLLDGDGDRPGVALGGLDGVRARLEVAQLEDGGLEGGDLDARRVRVAGALEDGDRERRVLSRHLDRVEDVARLDTAHPVGLDRDGAAAHGDGELRDGDEVDVELTRPPDDELRPGLTRRDSSTATGRRSDARIGWERVGPTIEQPPAMRTTKRTRDPRVGVRGGFMAA